MKKVIEVMANLIRWIFCAFFCNEYSICILKVFYDLSILLEFKVITPALHGGFLQKGDGDTCNPTLVMLPVSNTSWGSYFFYKKFQKRACRTELCSGFVENLKTSPYFKT